MAFIFHKIFKILIIFVELCSYFKYYSDFQNGVKMDHFVIKQTQNSSGI